MLNLDRIYISSSIFIGNNFISIWWSLKGRTYLNKPADFISSLFKYVWLQLTSSTKGIK